MPLLLKYGINYLTIPSKIWMAPFIFSAYGFAKMSEVYF